MKGHCDSVARIGVQGVSSSAWLETMNVPLGNLPSCIESSSIFASAGLSTICGSSSRSSRFFPEADDMAHAIPHSDANTKANELLFRRLTVEDAAAAHLAALARAPGLGFDIFIVSARTPFSPADCAELIADAPAVVAKGDAATS